MQKGEWAESRVMLNGRWVNLESYKRAINFIHWCQRVGIVIVFLGIIYLLAGCGGGGGGKSESQPVILPANHFTVADFSNKTIYLAESEFHQWSKGVFHSDNSVRAYIPNQDFWYQEGTWAIENGKLITRKNSDATNKTTYILIFNDTQNRRFDIGQEWTDGSVHSVQIFYDQVTGLKQAKEFLGMK